MIEEAVKESVKAIKPYEAPQAPVGVVKLDFNENLVIEEEWVKRLLLEAARSVDPRLYPSPYAQRAVESVANFLGVNADYVAVSNGSDEFVDLTVKAFVGYGDEAIVVEPTFEVYSLCVTVAGGVVKRFLLNDDMSLDVASLLDAVTPRTKLIFLCSPNNPTGNQQPRNVVKDIVEESRRLVVLDEAYGDFAEYSAIDMALSLPNLLVLRSFSKSFGLAGLRAGYAVGSKELISTLRRVDLPFRVSSVTEKVVELALNRWEYVKSKVEEVKRLRAELFKALSGIEGLKPYPSNANFILTKVVKEGASSASVMQYLAKKGFLVRDRGTLPKLENCLRITVGPRDVNVKLTEALREALEAGGSSRR
ncbi:MAG: histidinol-phosphate transaminase [Candidatus Nezhaarchaeales archaeon]